MESISSKTSIYDLVKAHPNIKNIMADLGFVDILKPGMLISTGRFMTLEKGAKLKKIDLAIIAKAFEEHGYVLNGGAK